MLYCDFSFVILILGKTHHQSDLLHVDWAWVD